MKPVFASNVSRVGMLVLAAAVLASGCGKQTAPGTKIVFGDEAEPNKPGANPAKTETDKAAYDQSVAQAALDRASAAIEKKFGKEKMAIIVVDGVPGPASEADRYLERKLFKAAYFDYEAAVGQVQKQNNANREAAEKQAIQEHEKTWGKEFGPSVVWYKYRPVSSDIPYPAVQGGPYGPGRHVYYVGPVNDIAAFGARIHVGQIVETDQALRTLKIQSIIPSPIPDIDVEELAVQVGAENVVTVEFVNVDGANDRVAYYLESQLNGPEDKNQLKVVIPKSQQSNKCTMAVGPIPDFHAFASSLKFGSVTQSDAANRKLSLTVAVPADLPARPDPYEESKKRHEEMMAKHKAAMDKTGGTVAEIGSKSPFAEKEADNAPQGSESQIDWAVRVLRKGDDPHIARKALTALTVEDVKEDRLDEIADLLVQFGNTSTWAWHVSETLIPTMGVWSNEKTVRYLTTKLTDTHYSSQGQAILQTLAKNPSEDAAKAVATAMTSKDLGVHASTALRDMGPVAEKTVLKLAQDRFPSMRIEAYDILRTIGTSEGLAKLKSLQATERDKDGKEALKSAIADLKKRLDEETAEAPSDEKSSADKSKEK